MWNEEDKMMELVEDMEKACILSPTTCPVCGEAHTHYFMHRGEDQRGRGTAWIWCDACESYTHFAYFVPDWWENPDFVDIEQLDSSVEYPHSIEGEIDDWIKRLLRK